MDLFGVSEIQKLVLDCPTSDDNCSFRIYNGRNARDILYIHLPAAGTTVAATTAVLRANLDISSYNIINLSSSPSNGLCAINRDYADTRYLQLATRSQSRTWGSAINNVLIVNGWINGVSDPGINKDAMNLPYCRCYY